MNLRPSGFGTATALQVGWASLQPPDDLATYDAVVLAIGSNGRIEGWAAPGGYDGEAHDRSFRLPEFQDDLILNATELNPQTIVVLHGGGGFNVQAWADKVGALLHAWFPGQYGGQPLAERRINANYFDVGDGHIWHVPAFKAFDHRCAGEPTARRHPAGPEKPTVPPAPTREESTDERGRSRGDRDGL